jgi:hypothetical protein
MYTREQKNALLWSSCYLPVHPTLLYIVHPTPNFVRETATESYRIVEEFPLSGPLMGRSMPTNVYVSMCPINLSYTQVLPKLDVEKAFHCSNFN